MNCQLCQKEMDGYREGKLPRDMMTQVESHMETCEACSGIYRLQVLAEKVMDQEKELQPDPYIAMRVMTRIDNLEGSGYKPATVYTKVLQPLLVTASMAASIFFGIILGNLSYPVPDREKIPVELALIDDIAIESVNILTNE
jgi:hypothetical protein